MLFGAKQALLANMDRASADGAGNPTGSAALDEATWRTVTIGRLEERDYPWPAEYPVYYSQLQATDVRSMIPGSKHGAPKLESAFFHAVRNKYPIHSGTPTRRLLASGKMGIGLGPPDYKVGDVLCILAGCSLPAILRPVDDHFLFVNDVYVSGIMYGEALKDHKLSREFETR
jgi:hypothetical protein